MVPNDNLEVVKTFLSTHPKNKNEVNRTKVKRNFLDEIEKKEDEILNEENNRVDEYNKAKRKIENSKKEYNIKKPSNLTIVYSSIFKNTVTENIFKKYAFIDKVFTVYTKDYIKENNVKINCEKSCKNCLKCYKKNNIKYISEEIHG